MKKNNFLVELDLKSNPISGECAQLLVQTLHHNNTLQELSFNKDYPGDVKEKNRLLQKEIKKKRETCGCQVKLKIYFW